MDIKVTVSGPMFNGDPARVLDKAIGQVIIAVSKAGVNEVKADLTPGHGYQTGKFRKTISRRKRGMVGTIYSKNTMISKWLEGGSSLIKRKSSFRGYGIWGPATQRTDRTAGEEARAIVAELVRELGGR